MDQQEHEYKNNSRNRQKMTTPQEPERTKRKLILGTTEIRMLRRTLPSDRKGIMDTRDQIQVQVKKEKKSLE